MEKLYITEKFNNVFVSYFLSYIISKKKFFSDKKKHNKKID